MAHDIVIRGGMIVDGTGAEGVAGDIAITGDVITAVGKVDESGRREIDASGCVVTPGFIDIHTHLDAQMGWDPDMTPVSWHGVTTALIGNCGMTFAPCKPEHRELLAGMMETVEDIPKHAILSGLAWDWEDYGGYLNSIERMGTAVNVAGLVGHAAVRYNVMGERSFAEPAGVAETRQMAEIVDKALRDGAFGFSTNRYEPHVAPDGRPIPGTYAEVEELEEIAAVVGARNGLMQAVGADFEVLRRIADRSNGRVLFSYGTRPEAGDGARAAAALDELAKGRNITAISHVRGSGNMFGLQTSLPVKGERWLPFHRMNSEERLAALGDAEYVAQLVEEAKAPGACRIPMDQVFYLGHDTRPAYTSEESVQVLADKMGEHWSQTLLRLSRESNGMGLFNFRMFSQSIREQADLFKSSHIFPGLGDAGAHVSQIMDAGWASFMLAYWYRDTKQFTLADTIYKMTAGPARVVGITDRGVLKPGMRADINVIDLDNVGELQPVLVNDFPGGAPRWIQKSTGFRTTLVNGRVSLVDGELTGNRSGKVLRHTA